MSSLPLISHHLFVAAVDERQDSHTRSVEVIARDHAVDLEIMDSTEPLPDPLTRSPGFLTCSES